MKAFKRRTLSDTQELTATSLETFVTLSGKILSEVHTEKASPDLNMAKGKLETSATARNIVYGNGVEVIGDTYALTNTHGDVKKLVDTVGNVVESYIYDAFGNILNTGLGTTETTASGISSALSEISGFINDILYASEQYDTVTGNYYLRARNYDPRIGRFTGEDDYHGDGRNLYTYVGNNPLMFVDPSGYCKESKVSGWKWALDGLKIVGGAVLCATGVGTAVGVSLIVSGVGDVVVDVMTECGANGKETAIVSDGVQIVSGALMLLNPVTAAAGAASIGSGVGGLAGGFAGEAIYEAATGEQSDTAFAVGSSVGNIIGGIAGDKVGKAIEAKKSIELAEAATSVKTIEGGYAKSSGNDKNLEKILEVMKKGEKTPDDRNIISQLDEETKVLFRMDVGDNAHTILSKGYTEPVNHINIEIQKLGQNGSYKPKWDYHIILDGLGQVTDSFPLGVWTK